MKAIIGIGNPGLSYKSSRHNFGFLVIERLARSSRVKINRRNYNYLFAQLGSAEEKVLLIKPLTFVNLSGQAVALLVRQNKLNLKDLLVVCDDVNLPLGKIRIKARGSAGGHKGLGSIAAALGTQEFPRLRIGAGLTQTQALSQNLKTFVLKKFTKEELEVVNQVSKTAADCCQSWLAEGIEAAMNKFNP